MSQTVSASRGTTGRQTRVRLGWQSSALAVASLVSFIACNDSMTPESPAAQAARAQDITGSYNSSGGVSVSPLSINAVPAARDCPPQFFVTGINLAKNPGFEVGPGPQTWPPGPTPPPSAAKGWFMHTDNLGATVKSQLVTTNVPGPGGAKMLAFQAGGAEGGVYQAIPTAPAKVMFSVWVKVTKGLVTIGANGTTGMTPTSSSTKLNEWEQLRVCTDGTYPTGHFFIYNEAAGGGTFFADRVEIKEIP